MAQLRKENWEGDFGSTDQLDESGSVIPDPYNNGAYNSADVPQPTAPVGSPTPPPGAGGNDQRVIDQYMKDFGHGPTASEAASEAENLKKYGWDTGPYGGVKAQIDKRMTNVPNSDGGSNANKSGGGNGGGYSYASGSGNSNSGAVPDPSKLISTLEGLYSSGGGFNNDIYTKRVSNASDSINRFKKSQQETDKAALANRGILGEGLGHESGPETTAYGRLGQNIADTYSNAVTGIQADESANADKRMMSALSLATGMSMADAQNAIEMFKANTDRTLGTGRLNLDTELGRGGLDLQRTLGTGQLALGNLNASNNYNISRDALAGNMSNAKMQHIIDLLGQGLTLDQIKAMGYY